MKFSLRKFHLSNFFGFHSHCAHSFAPPLDEAAGTVFIVLYVVLFVIPPSLMDRQRFKILLTFTFTNILKEKLDSQKKVLKANLILKNRKNRPSCRPL